MAKRSARVCVQCQERPALYFVGAGRRTVVRFRRDHGLCRQCFRGLKNSVRNRPWRDTR
jgi:hypothetical protein